METFNLLGYKISRQGLNADVATALDWLHAGEGEHVVACANPHSLVVASRDPLLQAALHSADLLLPDGVGVVHAARLFGHSLPGRVVGYDFFMHFSAMAQVRGGVRYFFLGATEEALAGMTSRLVREFPGITVCGSYAPSFSTEFTPEENRRMMETINQAKADVLWVGMTAPKQEKWIYQHREMLRVPCICAVGAVFDFYSGLKQRSPLFWQRLGLEWLHRLCNEPERLWERTVKSAPIFLLMVLKELLRNKKVSSSRSCMSSIPQKKSNSSL